MKTKLQIRTLNQTNEFNLRLEDLTPGTFQYITRDTGGDDDLHNNDISFFNIPTGDQIYYCLETNLHHLYHLLSTEYGDDALYDYIPTYLTEITSFLSGLYNKSLISWDQAKDFLRPIIGINLILPDAYIPELTQALTDEDSMKTYLNNFYQE